MRNIINFFIKYPILVNLGLILVLFLGISAFNQTRTTLLPQQPVSFIDISVVYRGASPAEVEEGIVIKIEDNMDGIQGIERVTSTSAENIATISVELTEDASADIVLQDVKNAVDKITTFPERIDEPVIVKRDVLNATINFAITGDVPLQTLKDIGDEVENDLLRREGLSQIFVQGYPEEEIEVQVTESVLRSYNLSIQNVADAIRNANLETSGGEIKTESQRILIRSNNKEYFAKDLRNIVVKAQNNGEIIYLSDVAEIKDRFSDSPAKQFVDGKRAVVFQIFSLNEEDILTNAAFVDDYIKEFNNSRESVEAVVIEDTTINLKKRISTLSSNGIVGAILVLLVLALFLDKRLAFWVALKIPTALLGMMIISLFYDLTVNMVSMFGAIIVLGILVDDGVVISENIYQHYTEKGKSAFKSAVDGTLEVMPAVFSSLTTTAIAFCLFFFIDGIIGDFFSDVAFVVVATLVVAMLDSFFFIPTHIAHSKALNKENKQTKIEKWFNDSMVWVRDNAYKPSVNWTVSKFSIPTVLIAIGILIITIFLVSSGRIGVTFFPNVEQDVLVANIELTPGTHERITKDYLFEIEDAVQKVNEFYYEDNNDRNIVNKVERIVGPKSHEGKIRLTLIPGEERSILSYEVSNKLREQIGDIPAAENLSVGYPAFIFGAPISVAFKGDDLEDLRAAKNDLREVLENNDDIKDITDTDRQGVTEINVKLKDQANLLGLNLGGVMAQVRAGFFGMEAQSLQRGDEEIKVWVRYAEDERTSIRDLEDMRIRTPRGQSFPLREVADLEFKSGVLAINHQDKQREIRVEADVANLDVPVPAVLADLEANALPKILSKYPGIEYSLEGQSRESAMAQGSVRTVLPIFLIFMFSLIVINFKSVNQALIVVFILPFSLIGVVIGHVIHGIPLSIFSGIGLIALIGVLINNSLVFMDTFNDQLKAGFPVFDAIVETARSRFRAIVLTTITTVAGLGPLILEGSLGAQFLKPPAISIAYGLAFGTTLTLIILPCLLNLNNKALQLYSKYILRQDKTPEEVEPTIKLNNQISDQ